MNNLFKMLILSTVLSIGLAGFAQEQIPTTNNDLINTFKAEFTSYDSSLSINKNHDLLELCDKIIEIAPNYTDAYNLKAQIFFHLNNYEEAEINAQRVLEKKPKDPTCCTIKGICELKKNNYRDAKVYFERLDCLDKTQINNFLLISLAYCEEYKKNPKIRYLVQNVKYYTYAKSLDKKRPETYFIVGLMDLQLKLQSQAKNEFNDYLKLSNYSQESYLAVANAYWYYSDSSKRCKMVTECIEKAIFTNPDNIQLDFLIILVSAYRQMGNNEKADEVLKSILSKQKTAK